MEKPTPITKEYVNYLNSLPPEILAEKVKDLTEIDKKECKKIMGMPHKPRYVSIHLFGFGTSFGLSACEGSFAFEINTQKRVPEGFEGFKRTLSLSIRVGRFFILIVPAIYPKPKIEFKIT